MASATTLIGDDSKTTERIAVDRQPILARLPIGLHLSDEEDSALSNGSTPNKAMTKWDDGSKLVWSPTGEDFTIAISRGSSIHRQQVPVLEGE